MVILVAFIIPVMNFNSNRRLNYFPKAAEHFGEIRIVLFLL